MYYPAQNMYCLQLFLKHVVMLDLWTGKAFKQNYKVRSGSYSLTGDRVEVYARYVTKEEETALDEMRSKCNKINHFKSPFFFTLKKNLSRFFKFFYLYS